MWRIALIALSGLLLLIVGWYVFNTRILESKDPKSAAPSSTNYEAVGDEWIAYSERKGSTGTAVIFVGGLSAWHGTWERTIRSLSDSPHTYIAIDLPPFGYSTVPEDADFTRREQAARISNFIAQKKAKGDFSRVILVAHSYGAGPAAEAVLRDQGTIRKFVVIDGVLNIDEERESARLIAGLGAVRTVGIGLAIHIEPLVVDRIKSFVHVTDHVDQELASLYTRSFDTKGTTKKLSSWVKAYVTDTVPYRSTDSRSYEALSIPVRIIWGAEDSLTPPALAGKLAAAVPDAELYMLEGVGHIPMIEDYAQFDAALKEALSE